MHNTPKGIPVPDAGDDLLRSYEAGFSAAGIVVPFSSVAAFRAALAAAEAAKSPASSRYPWYGDINGVLYRADGSKGANNAYDLEAVNRTRHYRFPAARGISGIHTLTEGQWKLLSEADLGVVPYDRWFLAIGSAWTRVKSGGADLELYRSRSDSHTLAKSGINHSDDGSTQVVIAGVIPAGQKSDIALYIFARKREDSAATLTVQLSEDEWTSLTIITGPNSMF